ncbi:uncharacterized protein LOC126858937 [Cataglyphis hispanica]|uniref:uncharacterized protein LOC126858937 n=1 Tax=Cataglyphis hispanica TaxID=1086592 RepID=UPI0021801550|nr:uncharacterized protein LOC126858937 [Cataglyphis hispanica]
MHMQNIYETPESTSQRGFLATYVEEVCEGRRNRYIERHCKLQLGERYKPCVTFLSHILKRHATCDLRQIIQKQNPCKQHLFDTQYMRHVRPEFQSEVKTDHRKKHHGPLLLLLMITIDQESVEDGSRKESLTKSNLFLDLRRIVR